MHLKGLWAFLVLSVACFVSTAQSADAKTDQEWEYSTQEDKMRGDSIAFASKKSENEIRMPGAFGASRLEILLRKGGPHGDAAILVVNKGQFQCYRSSGCKVAAKFDDGKIVTYTAYPSDAGRFDVIFLQERAGFERRLLKAKSLVLEVPFFELGRSSLSLM
ncbi:hypothetical protein [Neopusillimonas aromaticivorans]|uniref:hypothetical protein n=1 Tax=Neopusillimonas aromaticivorans TaxID=2979868 RepID=UPI00259401C7|nr:hypothetical protein [Neopusillimonas aromaticivorans]WJJ93448.1 hypothetical protein N7E01_16030 [Neopusillimonas aromaticivorans]